MPSPKQQLPTPTEDPAWGLLHPNLLSHHLDSLSPELRLR